MGIAPDIKTFLLKAVSKHPHDLVAVTARRFGISQQAVSKHIKVLIGQGKIVKIGSKRGTRYARKRSHAAELPKHLWTGLAAEHSIRIRKSLNEEVVWAEGAQETHVLVELALNPGETYFSRSQARRVTYGLEKFRWVMLDFRRVRHVGQGFVDEIFRVWKKSHSGVRLGFIHANKDVDFMIRRSLSPTVLKGGSRARS